MIKTFLVVTGLAGAIAAGGCVSHPHTTPASPSLVFHYSRTDRDDATAADEGIAAGDANLRPLPSPDQNIATHLHIQPDHPLSDLIVRMADVGTEEPMTPREFRSPPGARLANLQF